MNPLIPGKLYRCKESFPIYRATFNKQYEYVLYARKCFMYISLSDKIIMRSIEQEDTHRILINKQVYDIYLLKQQVELMEQIS